MFFSPYVLAEQKLQHGMQYTSSWRLILVVCSLEQRVGLSNITENTQQFICIGTETSFEYIAEKGFGLRVMDQKGEKYSPRLE